MAAGYSAKDCPHKRGERNNLPATLQDGPVPPRPTEDYQHLLFEELPPDGQKPEEEPPTDAESP